MLREFDLDVRTKEVPSGTTCFDWEIPQEWRIRDAYIADESGQRIVDYKMSNLHVCNGSVPVDSLMTFDELMPFLHASDHELDHPYRTVFFRDTWGFCISRQQLQALQQHNRLRVRIDSEYSDGSLTYGEAMLPGDSQDTVLMWTHICHPSLANDNVSGIATAACVYHQLAEQKSRRLSYRFVFAPATIGAIAWLSQNQNQLDAVYFALVLTLLGDESGFNFKLTRSGDHFIDRCLRLVENHDKRVEGIAEFDPSGYDERQFSSPGIDLPAARITRSTPEQFPEYHTSGDNRGVISENRILESASLVYCLLKMAEDNCLPVNTSPYCEPRLGPRGLFHAYGSGPSAAADLHTSILWTLNLADGAHDALAISERSGLPFDRIVEAIDRLQQHGLIRKERAPF